jgi:hypothetical protein
LKKDDVVGYLIRIISVIFIVIRGVESVDATLVCVFWKKQHVLVRQCGDSGEKLFIEFYFEAMKEEKTVDRG